MNGRSRALAWLSALVLTLSPLALAGCSSEASAKVAKVQPGDMPSGADWTGVYYSEQFGYLHMVQEGTQINGKWQRPTKEKWGELHGTLTGDVAHFSWTEYVAGLVGPGTTRTGKGYFKYTRPQGENVDDHIDGELGRNQDEVGDQPWEAVKQRRMMPDLKSIGGTGTTDVGGADWDKGNKEQGDPEPPKAP